MAHRVGFANQPDKKLDVSASYPNGGIVFNISRATTRKEIIAIVGVSETLLRRAGINLSSGHVNAVEICHDIFGMPNLTDWLDAFDADVESGGFH